MRAVETVTEEYELRCPTCDEDDVFDATLYVDGLLYHHRECVACGTVFDGAAHTEESGG